jgi:hypothetical protein
MSSWSVTVEAFAEDLVTTDLRAPTSMRQVRARSADVVPVGSVLKTRVTPARG